MSVKPTCTPIARHILTISPQHANRTTCAAQSQPIEPQPTDSTSVNCSKRKVCNPATIAALFVKRPRLSISLAITRPHTDSPTQRTTLFRNLTAKLSTRLRQTDIPTRETNRAALKRFPYAITLPPGRNQLIIYLIFIILWKNISETDRN